MLALLQRVNFAKVVVDGKVTGQIDKGILAFIGLEKSDDEAKCKRMFDKIVKYRMFYDENEKMNLNVEKVVRPPKSPAVRNDFKFAFDNT